MTREEFLNGEWFFYNESGLRSVYKFRPSKRVDELSCGCIVEAFANSNDTKEKLDKGWYDNIANVDKIGRNNVHAYTFVMGKKVNLNFKISDLKKIS